MYLLLVLLINAAVAFARNVFCDERINKGLNHDYQNCSDLSKDALHIEVLCSDDATARIYWRPIANNVQFITLEYICYDITANSSVIKQDFVNNMYDSQILNGNFSYSIEHNLTCSFRGCINFGDHCWYRNNESGMCSNIDRTIDSLSTGVNLASSDIVITPVVVTSLLEQIISINPFTHTEVGDTITTTVLASSIGAGNFLLENDVMMLGVITITTGICLVIVCIIVLGLCMAYKQNLKSKASFANQSQRNMVGWLGDNNYVNQEWDIHFDINSIYSVVTVENPLQQEIEMTDITIMDKDYMANNKFTVLDKTSIDNMSEVISASSDSLYF